MRSRCLLSLRRSFARPCAIGSTSPPLRNLGFSASHPSSHLANISYIDISLRRWLRTSSCQRLDDDHLGHNPDHSHTNSPAVPPCPSIPCLGVLSYKLLCLYYFIRYTSIWCWFGGGGGKRCVSASPMISPSPTSPLLHGISSSYRARCQLWIILISIFYTF